MLFIVILLFIVAFVWEKMGKKEEYASYPASIHRPLSRFGTLNHYNRMFAPHWYNYFPTFPWWWIPGGNYHTLY